MGLLLDIVVLSLSGWLVFATIRRLRQRRALRAWWLFLIGLVAIGLVLGYWVAFHFEYQVSTSYRFASFPMPVVIFHFENGEWVDFPLPTLAMYLGLATNIVTVTALAVLPLLVASLFSHRGHPA